MRRPFPFKQFGSLHAFLALYAMGLLAYGQTVAYPFVHDEIVFIQQNPALARFDWKVIIQGSPLIGQAGPLVNSYFRPLLELLYRLEYAFFGLNPAGYHLFNILLHVVNSFLVYALVNALTGSQKGFALAAAALFLLHPVQTESVACISGVSNLLFACFGLMSFYFYLQSVWQGGIKTYSLSLAALAMALLAKEQAAILPVLILWWEAIYSPHVLRPALKKSVRLGCYFAVLAAYFLMRQWLVVDGALPSIVFNQELVLRVLSIPRTLLMYLGVIVFPRNLHYYRSVDILQPNGVFVGLFLALFAVIAWIIHRTPNPYQRLLIWGAGWFCITLLPVLNIIPLVNEYSLILTAEHFLYLPLLGVLLFVLGLGRFFLSKIQLKRQTIFAAACVFFLGLFFLVATLRQNATWAGEIPLFERTVRFEKNLGRAHMLLAKAYYNNGEYTKAIQVYRRALAIMDGYLAKVGAQPIGRVYLGFIKEIHFDLAHCFEALGDFQGAVRAYLRALVLDPTDAVVHNNLGVIYLKQHNLKEAQAHFEQALSFDEHNIMAMKNLAAFYWAAGKPEQARVILQKMLYKEKNHPTP